MYSTSAFFDGFDLNTIENVTIYNFEANDLPNRDTKMNKLARADKSIITSSEYTSKEINVYGRICGDTKDDSEATLAELKGYIQQPNKILQLEQAGTSVNWTSTLTGMTVERYGIWIKFTLIFTAADPVGSDDEATSLLSATGITTSASSQAIDVEGSFKAFPVITVTVNSVTSGTDATITLSNSQIGQGITIERDWLAGDILEVDCENMTVIVNGAEHDYSGLFPSFYPGNRVLGYSDTFSARNVDISAVYNKQFV